MRLQTKQTVSHGRATQNKLHVRKGDRVKILAGKDVGKEGTIIEAIPSENRVIVEGVNIIKRHTKSRRLPEAGEIPGGIIEKPAPIQISNVQLICPKCNKPTRNAHKQDANGKSVRACKNCGEMIGG